ncbi:MAG: hypothetical protein JXA43_01375 [Candidatus Diapherotrites archaeon]|nr:hypothetical protein [Candidatus Diapherotrites archaeon]
MAIVDVETIGDRILKGELTVEEFKTEQGSFQAIRIPEEFERVKNRFGLDPEELCRDSDLVILNNSEDICGCIYPSDRPEQDVDEAKLLERFINGSATIERQQDNLSFGWGYPTIVLKD